MPDMPSGMENISGNLGDTSKLAFLDNIPLDSGGDNSANSQPPPQGATNDLQSNTAGGSNNDLPADNEDASTAVLEISEDGNTQTQAPPQQQPAAPSNLPVDYKDIDPADVPIFRKMDNTAKAKAKEWYDFYRQNAAKQAEYTKQLEERENELRELRDYRYYQAPDAYKLAPDYTTAIKSYQTQDAIVNHWSQQLAALEENRPIRDLLLDKEGNLTLSNQEIQPSPALRAQVMAAMQSAIAKRDSAGNNLEAFPTKYQERNKQFSGQLDQAVNALVSPGLLQHPTYKAAHDQYLNKVIPSHLRNVPVYQQMAKMAAFIQVSAKQITKLQQQLAAKGIKTAAVVNQGPGDGMPSNGDTSSSSWQNKKVKDIVSEFNAMKFGG